MTERDFHTGPQIDRQPVRIVIDGLPVTMILTHIAVDEDTGEPTFTLKQIRPNRFHRKRRMRSMRGK